MGRHKRRRHSRRSSKRSDSRRRRDSRSYQSRSSSSDGGDDSHDDREGLVRWRTGDTIRDGRYKVYGIAGQGTFGTVLDVYDTKHREKVVLKVVRSVKRYLHAAYEEIDILEKLRNADPKKGSLVVRLYGSFTTSISGHKHVCIAFERLGRSLYEFIKKNRYRGFRPEDLRPIGRQIAHSIRFCHAQKLTHTDLKLENVLFVNDSYRTVDTDKYANYRVPEDPRIRLIDFGGATFEDMRHARIINTRQYRAPEVILGLKWSYPSDMWSFGCIMAELATGELLFQTHSDNEHVKLMEVVTGKTFPPDMVAKGLEPFLKLQADPNGASPRSLRLPEAPLDQIFDHDTHVIKWPACAPNEESVSHVARCQPLPQLLPDSQLSDLVARCLAFHPEERISAEDAFNHPYFTDSRIKDSVKLDYMDVPPLSA